MERVVRAWWVITALWCVAMTLPAAAQTQPFLAVRVTFDPDAQGYTIEAELLDADALTGGNPFSPVVFFDFVIEADGAIETIEIAPPYRSPFFGFIADPATGRMQGQAEIPPVGSYTNENPTVLGTFRLAPGSELLGVRVVEQFDGCYDDGDGDVFADCFFYQGSDGLPGDVPFRVIFSSVPDPCEPGAVVEDCDQNGIDDSCDRFFDPLVDCDGDGLIDSCELLIDPSSDCDGNGVNDACDLFADPRLDCDGDGVIDSCQVVLNPSSDCNGNGLVDSCEIINNPLLDCDRNLRLDVCDIADDPQADCDSDGTLDACQVIEDPSSDCDVNGLVDACEIAADPSLDCDGDGRLDVCQIAEGPFGLDCNENGRLDTCEIADDPGADSDANGILDVCFRNLPVCVLADVNGDRQLNGADFNAWLNAFGSGLPGGDQNNDGVFNGADFNAWLANYSEATVVCP